MQSDTCRHFTIRKIRSFLTGSSLYLTSDLLNVALVCNDGVTDTFPRGSSFPFKCLDVQIACAKEPPGTATVHYFFARARLDLQFLTICVHIGHIWSASVQQSHWLSQLCRIFLWDCSSFIRQPRETRTSNLTDKAFVLVNGYFNYWNQIGSSKTNFRSN